MRGGRKRKRLRRSRLRRQGKMVPAGSSDFCDEERYYSGGAVSSSRSGGSASRKARQAARGQKGPKYKEGQLYKLRPQYLARMAARVAAEAAAAAPAFDAGVPEFAHALSSQHCACGQTFADYSALHEGRRVQACSNRQCQVKAWQVAKAEPRPVPQDRPRGFFDPGFSRSSARGF